MAPTSVSEISESVYFILVSDHVRHAVFESYQASKKVIPATSWRDFHLFFINIILDFITQNKTMSDQKISALCNFYNRSLSYIMFVYKLVRVIEPMLLCSVVYCSSLSTLD